MKPPPESPAEATVAIGAPGRVPSGWQRTYRLGEPCVIPLALREPGLETRVFLKHDGIFYVSPFGEWAERREIRFFPEAPGAYVVLIEWRSPAGGSGWTEAGFALGRPEDPSPRLVAIDRRTRIWVPSAWESKIAAGHEQAALAAASRVVRKDAVIYDIGANLGLYAIVLSRIAGAGGHVYCIEANPVCLYFLQANLALNQVPSFEILPLAMLGAPTSIEFRINYRNLLVGIAGPLPYMGKPGHVIDVSAAPLDQLIADFGLRPPDFIKMDIEGAEVHAIAGMKHTLARHRPAIMMELHGQAAAQGTLDAAGWAGYRFEEISSGRTFGSAADLRAWFPEACLQILALP